MDPYITGSVIRKLREKRRLTQGELAEKLHISDKTVSKWETGKGLPDITLLEPLAAVFRVSVAELISGKAVENTNPAANFLRGRFYVCPVCGNVMVSTGEAAVHCHGIALPPLEAEEAEEGTVSVEAVEDEWFVTVDHPMEKAHYISFVAGVSGSGVQVEKLYPEGAASVRLKRRGVRRIYVYCNRDGLYVKKI